jgi:formate dehydrogenase subunit gamma
MPSNPRTLCRTLLLAAALALSGLALAQSDAKGPPANFVAAAQPKPGETNAERARTQPGNNAPFWSAVRRSSEQAGTVTLPGAEKGVLIQSLVQYPGSRLTTAGEAWRQVRNRWIVPLGGSLLLIAALATALFHWRKGPLGGHEPDTGMRIERFTYFERAAHWVNAIAFSVLAVSGIVMAFGKFFVLPVIGGTLFGWLTYALKNAHNFAGPLFAVSLTVVFVTYVRDNLPRAGDLTWLVRAGGVFGDKEVPSHRFNAGEKIMFWAGAFLFGGVVVGSGLFLDMVLPAMDYVRGNMQIAHMIHAVAALLMMAIFIGHIYLGTIGMKGAYRAMRTGYVTEGWAREHHALWAEDIRAGRIPAQRNRDAAPAAQPAVQS